MSCSSLDSSNALGRATKTTKTTTHALAHSPPQKDQAHHNAPRFQHLHHLSQATRRDKVRASVNTQPRSWCRMKSARAGRSHNPYLAHDTSRPSTNIPPRPTLAIGRQGRALASPPVPVPTRARGPVLTGFWCR